MQIAASPLEPKMVAQRLGELEYGHRKSIKKDEILDRIAAMKAAK